MGWCEKRRRAAAKPVRFHAVPTLLQGATLVEFEPARVEVGDLRIARGKIVERAPSLTPQQGEDTVDLRGRLVLPGLVSAHHHVHGLVLRALFKDMSFHAAQALMGKVELNLDTGDLQALALSAGLEGLVHGTTSVCVALSAPNCTPGALTHTARGLTDAGARSVVAYELVDAHGAGVLTASLEETVAFLRTAVRSRSTAGVALASLDTLDDEWLSRAAQAPEGLHVFANVAEDGKEEERCTGRYGKTPLERLEQFGLIGPSLVLTQGVHLSWPELSRVLAAGAYVAHSPRANMMLQVGSAPAGKFGVYACLGTDVMPLDVLSEAQAAWLKGRDVEQPIDIVRFLANGHRLASAVFGVTLGPLQPGAQADVMVLDYVPASELSADTLGRHLALGLSSHHVESVMVDGVWRVWRRKPLAQSPTEVAGAARQAVAGIVARAGLGATPA